MTHDELLARIDSFSCCSGAHELALRATVELHKPTNFILRNDEVVEQWCTADGSHLVPYPCPTIKTIEKELV